jgi:DNA-binding transcriptional MocR family regulator
VPAERTLAAVTGTSRGTVVACFDHLTEAGVLTRRQGAGTYVAGRPSWAARPAPGTVATMLLRRVAEDREIIDLSVSAPGDLRHLPPADPGRRGSRSTAMALTRRASRRCGPRSPAT